LCDPCLFACTAGDSLGRRKHRLPKGRLSCAMIYPEADKLEDWGSKYALVALAAKRAKQIKAGAPILVDTQSRNPLTIALEEIAAGRITCTVSEHDIVISSTVEPEVAGLLAIPIADEETEEALTEAGEASAMHDMDEEEEEEEDYIDEEEEEEGHDLGPDDVWREVLQDDTEEDSGLDEHIVVDPDAEEEVEVEADAEAEPELLIAPEEKPKRRGRKKAADVEADISGEAGEADEEQPEDE
jgi:DNA-directed RNA polymerase subunit omega